MINKGTVSAILEGGKKISVKPYMGESVTVALVVPYFLFGCLEVNMPVVYASFPDNTGIVIARMDGEWNKDILADIKVRGNITVDGNVNAKNFISSVASFNGHTHSTEEGTTSGPR